MTREWRKIYQYWRDLASSDLDKRVVITKASSKVSYLAAIRTIRLEGRHEYLNKYEYTREDVDSSSTRKERGKVMGYCCRPLLQAPPRGISLHCATR